MCGELESWGNSFWEKFAEVELPRYTYRPTVSFLAIHSIHTFKVPGSFLEDLLMSQETPGTRSDEQPVFDGDEVPSRRKTRGKQTRHQQDDFSDSDDYMPVPKRAKPGPKKASPSPANRPSKSPTQTVSKSIKPPLPSTSRESDRLVPLLPSTGGETLAMPPSSSGGDSMSQYQGIPLEELRLILSPQEYIKVSILRSMAESPHGGKDKNVPKFLHPHLTASALTSNLNWEMELRSMIATWIDMPFVTTSVLSILESEAVRYTTRLLQDLTAAVEEHVETGFVNDRPQKSMMFSNQAQRIDLKAVLATQPQEAAPAADATPSSSTSMDAAPTTTNTAPIASNATKTSSAKVRADTAADEDYEAEEDEDEEDDADDADEVYPSSSAQKKAKRRSASDEDEAYSEETSNGLAGAAATAAAAATTTSVRGTTKAGFARIPIGTLDHLAEALVKRHPSLVRRLEYIMKRLAEDDEAQQVNKDAQAEHVSADALQDDDSDPPFNPEDVWVASSELEDYIAHTAPTETRERQQELRDMLMAERMLRVEKIPVAKLDDWQNASSISFARPRRLHKFKAWLVQCCHWNQHALCIPSPLATAINFLTYEHLRYIVRASLASSASVSDGGAPMVALLPERLREEIEARIAAGDFVQIAPLATNHLQESSPS